MVGRQRHDGANCAVDVKPQLLATADCGQFRQVIYSAGIDRARIADHAARLSAGIAIRVKPPQKYLGTYLIAVVNSQLAEGAASVADYFHGLLLAAVPL